MARILVNFCTAIAVAALVAAPVLGALPSALDVRTFSSVIKGGLVEPGACERGRALRFSHSTFLSASLCWRPVSAYFEHAVVIHCEMHHV
jgi:hypothetical protein